VKRVFISFRHEDKQQINGLRLLAANQKFDIEFYDESLRTAIDSTNAPYVRSKIREKINRTSVLIGKSVTFWPSLKGGGKWGRAELLRSNSTML
jgi:MTH538 TIR-like domain (DUF1863)